MAINLGDALSYLDIPQTGIGAVELPVAKPFRPEYGVEFDINKWQTTKVYCNDACKPTFSPNRGKPRGRPKNEWKEVFQKYDI